MRRFAYNEQGHKELVIITEDEIRATYWPFWKDRLERLDRHHLISWENCLEDFLVVNWAWEVDEQGQPLRSVEGS